MSHIAECKAELKSLDLIEAAAKRLGGELIRGQQSYAWYGPWSGLQIPVGMTADDLGKCDHAIRFPMRAQYEIGVRAQENGSYALAWDYYDDGGLLPIMGDQYAGRFVQAYGVEAAKRAAARRGYSTRETTTANGDVQLEMIAR